MQSTENRQIPKVANLPLILTPRTGSIASLSSPTLPTIGVTVLPKTTKAIIRRLIPETKEANAFFAREAWKATEEGRRLYVGNLDWQIKAADVALWIEGAGYTMRVVDMPVQPEDPRRAVFCFVELFTAEETKEVKEVLNGRLMRGRPVRIDLSRSKQSRDQNIRPENIVHEEAPSKPTKAYSDAGVDISKLNLDAILPSTSKSEAGQTLAGKLPESTRLFVGGLPHIENINELEDLITELFHGFHVESLSGIFSSKKGKYANTENNSYCFVDLVNREEAKMAVRFLNSRETSWGIARVNYATGATDAKLEYHGHEQGEKQAAE
ncbi:hypothetical protein ABW20_dc0102487 [Dactylellina cionopaga]|nr:hypothetical protein ABW20_dc0102487 [Dactylellina cionopaga]